MRFRLRRTTILTIILLIGLVILELKTSYFQSFVLSQWAQRMDFEVEDGPNKDLIFPEDGPFDKRLGYTRVQDFTAALVKNGFVVERQSRTSGAFRAFQNLGGFPPYREKTSAGMTLLAAGGKPYFTFRQPAAFYPSYAAVPAPVVASLLFVENRELLDTKYPRRNPAVEWERFSSSVREARTDRAPARAPSPRRWKSCVTLREAGLPMAPRNCDKCYLPAYEHTMPARIRLHFVSRFWSMH